jgi:hypothetical protein
MRGGVDFDAIVARGSSPSVARRLEGRIGGARESVRGLARGDLASLRERAIIAQLASLVCAGGGGVDSVGSEADADGGANGQNFELLRQ